MKIVFEADAVVSVEEFNNANDDIVNVYHKDFLTETVVRYLYYGQRLTLGTPTGFLVEGIVVKPSMQSPFAAPRAWVAILRETIRQGEVIE